MNSFDIISMDDPPRKNVRILCFGDSLTAGYSMWGMQEFPYAEELEGPLQKLSPLTNITIDVDGLSGDSVLGPRDATGFIPRLRSRCSRASAGPYDWILIMGGTNDLGRGADPEDVYEGLKKCWKLALDTGAKVLAMNVIEAAFPSESLIQRRNKLNSLIANHHEGDQWYTLDISAAVPYFSMDEKKREMVWDDGLHLKKNGYRMMGDAIAARLVDIISNEIK